MDDDVQPKAAPVIEPAEVPETESTPGFNIRIIVIPLVVLIVIIAVGLIAGVIGAATNPDGWGNLFRILRDFFIIVLALQGILVTTALVILVIQVSSLVNMLREEITPIVKETRETLATVRGTATFMKKSVAEPIIRTAQIAAGTRAFIGGAVGVFRLLNRKK